MLFNSFEFLFVFLPITVLGFAALQPAGHVQLIRWLLIVSLVFYGYWQPLYLPILIGSILFNFAVGRAILQAGRTASRRILIAGVAANLSALAFFKYAAFLVGTFNDLSGTAFALPRIDLPLGISFFTFTQIAYLVDAHQRRLAAERGLAAYALFVTYFPHLIAGPILHHKPMLDQFAQPGVVRLHPAAWAVGATFFAIGLAKKVLLADPLGAYATPLFDAVRDGAAPSLVAAWAAALAYTFQLYFDFSGYSDMAVGLSLLFGITIPINFASPYRATSVIEFWRRWHISLSIFLRDYLYIPLGGNRRGRWRRYLNIMITMVLGGLWHGANWTFVAWGALHGLYLLVNHAWRALVPPRPQADAPNWQIGRLLGGILTFLAVTVAWVVFRADNFPAALRMLRGMASFDAIPTLPLAALVNDPALIWPLLAVSAAIAFLFPNSNEICAAIQRKLASAGPHQAQSFTALIYGCLLGLGVIALGRATQFLYFQF